MTIIDITKEIKAKEQLTKADEKTSEWKPEKVDKFTVPPFSIPVTRKKNVQKEKFSKVLAFIDSVKHFRRNEGCTIIHISTKNKRLISICGSHQEVSRLIQFMIEVGLLSIESDEYQYNANCKGFNKCKIYRYYYENEILLKKYCKDNNINIYVIRNNKSQVLCDTVVHRFTISNFDDSQVKFNSKLNLLKPDNYSILQFEDYLYKCLYENYPELSAYQSLADRINTTYYQNYPELTLRFIPNFTWDKNFKAVKKIGIRCTNSLVSAKKNKDNRNFNGLYKEDIINKYKLNLEKDVKSSVPRITLSMNNGYWVDESNDIYEIIYKIYLSLKYNIYDSVAEKYTFEEIESFEVVRDSIKYLHMRVYFDSEKRLGVNTRNAMRTVIDKNEVDNEMNILRQAVLVAEGGYLYDNEIFYHESCIYLDVLYELLSSGFFVWQCYDAFYARKTNVYQEEFEILVSNMVKKHANNYIARNATYFMARNAS